MIYKLILAGIVTEMCHNDVFSRSSQIPILLLNTLPIDLVYIIKIIENVVK